MWTSGPGSATAERSTTARLEPQPTDAASVVCQDAAESYRRSRCWSGSRRSRRGSAPADDSLSSVPPTASTPGSEAGKVGGNPKAESPAAATTIECGTGVVAGVGGVGSARPAMLKLVTIVCAPARAAVAMAAERSAADSELASTSVIEQLWQTPAGHLDSDRGLGDERAVGRVASAAAVSSHPDWLSMRKQPFAVVQAGMPKRLRVGVQIGLHVGIVVGADDRDRLMRRAGAWGVSRRCGCRSESGWRPGRGGVAEQAGDGQGKDRRYRRMIPTTADLGRSCSTRAQRKRPPRKPRRPFVRGGVPAPARRRERDASCYRWCR